MKRKIGVCSSTMIGFLALTMILGLCSCGVPEPTKNQPPRYPNSRYIPDESGQKELKGTKVYYSFFETFDPWKDVVKFYKDKLDTKEGWTSHVGDEYCTWTNGNISAGENDNPTDPVDPGKVGGYVSLYKGEGRTFIRLIWSDPKK